MFAVKVTNNIFGNVTQKDFHIRKMSQLCVALSVQEKEIESSEFDIIARHETNMNSI